MDKTTIPFIFGLIFAVGAWYIFPYTTSKYDRYKTSPLDMVGKRIGSVIASGLLAFVVISNAPSDKALQDNSIGSVESKTPKNNMDNVRGDNLILRPIEGQKPPKDNPSISTSSASATSPLNKPALREQTPPVQSQNKLKERIYTEDEIREMEIEKKYSGNDPIVRRRLGLPSRETGKM